jgi:hypothetical protein
MSNLTINLSPADLQQNSDYAPIPAGTYNATVFNAELTEVKSGENAGKPQYKLQFRISDGKAENRRIFTYVPLYTGKAFWKSQAFFSALGYDMSEGSFTVPTPNELAGKAVAVKVTVVPGQNGGEDNNVAGFVKAGTATASSLAEPINVKSASEIWVS